MRHFDEIFAIAAERHGGISAVEQQLTKPDPDVSSKPDSFWLATLTKCIFQAGFSWRVIEQKWDGFEETFHGFDLGRNAFMDDETFDTLLRDTRIVRNAAKILTVRDNAAFLLELRAEGGVGEILGGWPASDYIGLLEMLKKRGSRLGGASAQYAMRFAGRDAFILTQDVTARLIAEGVIDKPATSKSALRNVQEAFNTWSTQSGRSLSEISRVLALSV